MVIGIRLLDCTLRDGAYLLRDSWDKGMELLRLLENHKKIFTVPIESKSMSVDTEKDLERVRKAIRDVPGGANVERKSIEQ